MVFDGDRANSVLAWADGNVPKIWMSQSQTDVTINVPQYSLRRIMAARDPWAVMLIFMFSVKYLLARLLGSRMCFKCPLCNLSGSQQPCANAFGHNMMPWVGFSA